MKELYTSNLTCEQKEILFYRPCTDAGNAERIAGIIGDNWQFCQEIRTWLYWNGKYWEEASKEDLVPLAVDSMRFLADYGNNLPLSTSKEEQKKRENIISWLHKSENNGKIIQMLNIFSALQKTSYKKFDSGKWELNCQNGTVNLKTGVLNPHIREDYNTKICNASYRAFRPGCLWEKTIKAILPDKEVRHWMQKFIGYCLTPSTQEEKFVVLYGPGGRGKGTLIETIGHVLNNYKATLSIDVLLSAKYEDNTSGNGPTPEIAKLPGKRLVLSSESGKGRRFDEAKIKLLTGGDAITARRLRCDPFEFTPAFKLVLSSNYLPAISDSTDEGIRRRLVIIPCVADIPAIKDNTLKQKLLEPGNLSDVLAWAVNGCLMWQREKLGEAPPAAREVAERFYHNNDLIAQWLEEECTVDHEATASFMDAFTGYNRWVTFGSGNKKGELTRKGFNEAMERHGFTKTRKETGYVFKGFKLNR